ncbi:hypothetical protein PF003_g36676 [Phytophthora fragariae]|nr:hypothetical protein PF003_g36676 [Phytophthora fragariae]
MRFPEVMDIPAGETRTVELVIHPRADGAASALPASSSSTGSFLGLNSRTSGAQLSAGMSGPASSPPGSSSAIPTQPSSGVQVPPSKSIRQLHQSRLATLTPAEKLRRYSNPKSSTAAGSRVKPHVPPPQPYACPLPGEEGHAEAASQLDETAREVGFPPSSSSQQESGPDSSHPAEFQEFADVDDSSLDFDGFGLQQILLVPYAASPTSSSAPATSPVGTPSPQPRVLNLYRGMAPLSLSAELSGVSPVDVVFEPATTSAESDTVTLSAALALPPTAEYPTSVRWIHRSRQARLTQSRPRDLLCRRLLVQLHPSRLLARLSLACWRVHPSQSLCRPGLQPLPLRRPLPHRVGQPFLRRRSL